MNRAVLNAFLAMTPRDCDAWMMADETMKNAIAAQIVAFPAFALPSLDAPATICGIVHAFGAGSVWMITGVDFERVAGRVLAMQRQLCASMYVALALRRMDMRIEHGRTEVERWAGALGFEFETVLQRHGARGEHQAIWLWPDERN